jgi:chromosome segregation ATPase
LQLDLARNEKEKAKREWQRLDKNLKDKRVEAKVIFDDNNPYTKRIKLLENKLDKAMIKYNEAMSIRRTYEQILDRLKQERAGYDIQITSIQQSLKTKQHDSKEFKQLLHDAQQAKHYSEMLLKNTELSVNKYLII